MAGDSSKAEMAVYMSYVRPAMLHGACKKVRLKFYEGQRDPW